jgi:peptidoglycan/LPS O-acetylase OafA/YrhL
MNHTKQILGLDLVRVTAALLVVLFHLGYAINVNPGGTLVTYQWIDPYVRFGWVGVEIFFVLSGFVIAYSASSSTPSNFVRSRAIRLYPSAWICASITLFTLTALHVHQELMFHRYLKSMMLYLKGPFIDGSFWTLPLEIAFYVLIFALLWRKGFKHLDRLMVGLGIFSAADNLVVWRVLLNESHNSVAAWLTNHPDNLLQSLTLAQFGVFFALGSLLWLSLHEHATGLRLFGMCVCVAGAFPEIYRHAVETYTEYSPIRSFWIPPMLVWATSLGLIVASVRYNATISRALGSGGAATARKLGLMTYPLYLVHQQVGFALIAKLKGLMGDFAAFALVLFIVIVLSFLVVTFIERPLQKRLRHLLHGSQKATQVPISSLP